MVILINNGFIIPVYSGYILDTQAPSLNLTKQELVVLSYLLKGVTPSDISKKLNRSQKTISAQKISLYRKLKVRNDLTLFRDMENRGVLKRLS